LVREGWTKNETLQSQILVEAYLCTLIRYLSTGLWAKTAEKKWRKCVKDEKDGDGKLIFWEVNDGGQMPQVYATTLLKGGVMEFEINTCALHLIGPCHSRMFGLILGWTSGGGRGRGVSDLPRSRKSP